MGYCGWWDWWGSAWVRRLTTAWQQQERTGAALRRSNHQLKDLMEESGRLNREISLVSDLADQLHACMTSEEAHQIVNHMMPRLFPEQSGALFLLNASRNILEMTVTWGENPPDQPMLDPQSCWALRRGRPYLMQDPEQDLICDHLSPPLASGYYCVPLVAQGETLGVLHLRTGAPAPGRGFPSGVLRVHSIPDPHGGGASRPVPGKLETPGSLASSGHPGPPHRVVQPALYDGDPGAGTLPGEAQKVLPGGHHGGSGSF